MKCQFQRKLANDARKITSSSNILLTADESNSFYSADTNTYNWLLANNITKAYKREEENAVHTTNLKSKHIAKNLQLDDRINTTAKKEAFITLKDHELSFLNNPQRWLINPAEPEIGKISKQISDRANTAIRKSIKVNQWKNISVVIDWFSNTNNTYLYSFNNFDVVELYLSITPELLTSALDFASEYDKLTAEKERS